MREILFRGKRIDNGEWVEGWLYKRFHHKSTLGQNMVVDAIEVYDGENPLSLYYCEVDPSTVGQYTGLTVKEKRLFEHDIITVRDKGKEIYRFVVAFGVCGGVQNVEHIVGFMGFHFIPANEETRHCMKLGARNDPLYWMNTYDCEVIGNIHDNPELMEA